MAVVYRVRDQAGGSRLALKQLRAGERARERITRLFQHEYQALSDLAHPRIVRVLDYGVDDRQPYYTMELLEGEDLAQGGSLAWRDACALLRDVAVALAVVHSRRLVHRDVTPRNVRRGEDGRAKLIDFGALSPMGTSAPLVGTPAFVPPEALHGQPLDGRTDLYALGALAYFLLTGRHAYPARRFDELRERWRSDLAAPSALVPELPEALSALVLALLSLDLLRRPTTAWEVIDRLEAIAGLAPEQSRSARPGLLTPMLVGREQALTEARGRLVRTLGGPGTVLWTQGPAGAGRRRLLSTLVLEARLLGLITARADGDAGRAGDFGVMAELVQELRATAGAAGRELPPELERLLQPSDEPQSPEQRARRLAEGRTLLVHWLLQVADARGLLLAVDAAHTADPASAAVLRELTQAAPRHKLAVALSLAEDEPESARWVPMLRRDSPAIALQPLSEPETEAMLGSVFGEAAHLKVLSHVVHGLAQGNPGTTMGLAQQLLDQGAVRYEAGRWVLPSDPRKLGLPGTLKEALAARVLGLGQDARTLAEGLALIDPMGPIRTEHYAQLLDPGSRSRWFIALDALVRADVLRVQAESYAFSHPALAGALREALAPERARELHVRLAAIYADEPYRDVFMQGWHLQQAGHPARAAELLARRAQQLNNPEALSRLNARYKLARRAYLSALQHYDTAGGAIRARFELRRSLVNLAAYYDPRLVRHALPVIDQLVRDTGLVYWSELAPTPDPSARVRQCLAHAKRCWEQTPETERCLPPDEAVPALAYLVMALSGGYGRTLDLVGLETLPPLIEPFRTLSPALDLLAEVVLAALDGARGLESTPRRAAILKRIEHDPALRGNATVLATANATRYYLGVWEARGGGRKTIERADEIDRRNKEWEQLFPASVGFGHYRGWHVRLLGHLYNGDVRRAKLCRQHIELLQLDGLDALVTPNVRMGAYHEAHAHALVGSLPELRDTIDVIAELSEDSPSWLPVLAWARGEYQRLRGNLGGARAELELALQQTAPGRHLIWMWATTSLVDVLRQDGEPEVAHELGQRALGWAEELDLARTARRDLERALALAEAEIGALESAAYRLDTAIAAASAANMGGVPLARLHEARAQVAVLAGDPAAFELHERATAQCYRQGRHPALVARHAHLLDLAELAALRPTAGSQDDGGAAAARDAGLHTVHTAMASCKTPDQRAARALSLLVEHAGASHGHLFTAQEHGLQVRASFTGEPPPEALVRALELLAQRELEDLTAVFGAIGDELGRIDLGDGSVFHPLWLRSTQKDGETLAGVAALCCPAEHAPRVSWRLQEAISDYLLDAGDVSSLLTIG